MEPISVLAASAVAVITPYLVEAGKAVAKKAGEATWARAEELYSLIKAKFSGHPVAEEALADLEKDPQDEDNQAVLRKQLRKLLETDQAFLEGVRGKVEAIHQGGGIVVSGSGAAATSGGTAAGAGGVAVGGSVEGGVRVGQPLEKSE